MSVSGGIPSYFLTLINTCNFTRLHVYAEFNFNSIYPSVYHPIYNSFMFFVQAYVNMALFENFTYAGIDATAEEA